MSAEEIIKAPSEALITRHGEIINLLYEAKFEQDFLLSELGLIEAELKNRRFVTAFLPEKPNKGLV